MQVPQLKFQTRGWQCQRLSEMLLEILQDKFDNINS
jgi:hypothetical protein